RPMRHKAPEQAVQHGFVFFAADDGGLLPRQDKPCGQGGRVVFADVHPEGFAQFSGRRSLLIASAHRRIYLLFRYAYIGKNRNGTKDQSIRMKNTMAGKTILTGVKPTGAPHLGNYVGAIRPAIKLVEGAEKSFLFIADYHALNAV